VSIGKLAGFYGFTRMPFGRNLAPGMLHRHAGHGEAAARITWAVTEKALGVITGEVGVGKTVAAHAAVAASTPPATPSSTCPTPPSGSAASTTPWSPPSAAGPPTAPPPSPPSPPARWPPSKPNAAALPSVLVIDEAHLLDSGQLETVRMLTNHDIDSAAIFACLLIGQPTLRRRLKLGQLAALDQRIAVRYHMTGMTGEETASYLHHHLALAGRSDTWIDQKGVRDGISGSVLCRLPDRPLNRLSTAFRIFLVIPIAIVLGTVSGEGLQLTMPSHSYGVTAIPAGAGGVLFFGPLLMILFRQKYPRWWFEWNLELQRFTNRVGIYLALMDDRYPSTDDHQSVHLDYRYPDHVNRWLPLVKWLLAIPHYVVLFFLDIAAFMVVIVIWFVILFTGRYPRGMFGFVEGVIRWNVRVTGYAITLVTDRYPPFRLAP
jgi:Domain of unknown function (DUF4389)